MNPLNNRPLIIGVILLAALIAPAAAFIVNNGTAVTYGVDTWETSIIRQDYYGTIGNFPTKFSPPTYVVLSGLSEGYRPEYVYCRGLGNYVVTDTNKLISSTPVSFNYSGEICGYGTITCTLTPGEDTPYTITIGISFDSFTYNGSSDTITMSLDYDTAALNNPKIYWNKASDGTTGFQWPTGSALIGFSTQLPATPMYTKALSPPWESTYIYGEKETGDYITFTQGSNIRYSAYISNETATYIKKYSDVSGQINITYEISPQSRPYQVDISCRGNWYNTTILNPYPPTAAFTGSPTSGTAPLTVQFTDTSTGSPASWLWNFGDGYTSTAQNPTHIYLYPGQYSIHLTAQNANGYNETVKPHYITVTSSQKPPTAAFTGSPTTGTAPLTVQFTDTSTGSPASWSWEFGDGWGSSAQNPTHTYVAPGTYTVTLTAYNSVGSDVETKTGYITVEDTPQPADAILNGYAYDNTNSVLLDGVTITIENETYSATNITHGGGFYQFAGLTGGTYTLKGEKAGYLSSPDYAVQLYSGAVVQRDISLGVSGVAIVGTVYDAVTGEKLNGANVTATQGTASYSSTGAGQYALNGLSKGVETTITASLAGYTHTPVTLTPTSSAPYTIDLYLIPDSIAHNGTALAGLVTDAATHNAIPNAQVSLPGHANATTSPTGFYLFDDLTAGSYYVSASASGYKPSRDYAVNLTEGALTLQDISLDPSVTTATNMEYPPHLVRILCIDEYNRPLENVTIQAAYQQSSSPIDWLAEWLGITPDIKIISETLEGTTGIDGSVVFLMVESVQYRITVDAPKLNMTKSFDLYPKEDQITVRFVTSSRPDTKMPEYELTATEDGSDIILNLKYTDTTNATTSLFFTAVDTDTLETLHIDTFGATSFPGTIEASFRVENTKGAMYRFGFEAQNTAHGTISQYKGITLKGDGLLVDLGFEDHSLYNWLAVILLFLFAGAFSGTNVKQGAILVPLFGGGLFWLIGWLPITLGAAISAIGFLGVLVYMRKSEWKVRA